MAAMTENVNRQLYGWQEVAHQLGGVGRSTVFKLWATNQLASCKVGRLRFSTAAQIAEYVARLEGAA